MDTFGAFAPHSGIRSSSAPRRRRSPGRPRRCASSGDRGLIPPEFVEVHLRAAGRSTVGSLTTVTPRFISSCRNGTKAAGPRPSCRSSIESFRRNTASSSCPTVRAQPYFLHAIEERRQRVLVAGDAGCPCAPIAPSGSPILDRPRRRTRFRGPSGQQLSRGGSVAYRRPRSPRD